MAKSFMAKRGEVPRKWWLVDADGQILGRLAARVARILMGKTKPFYTPNTDTGDFVVVVNASKIRVTSDKPQTKTYQQFSGYPGGQKRFTLAEMLARKPAEVIRLAVRRMLPKSRLARKMLTKLKVHDKLPAHGYKAQKAEPLPPSTRRRTAASAASAE
jgi:large subunit ribosomal protein L13